MAVKAIVEFQSRPGRRPELLRLMERIGDEFGPVMRERGSLHYALYEGMDNPDLIVEIADWETAEAREALLQEAVASGAFAPLMELLAAPPKATYLRAPA